VPPKARVPAPIDRPLSRAYLREFSGWATAYPPGLSQPTSLRIMENAMVNRDGSLRVRPGLKYLSYDGALAMAAGLQLVGTHEVFFLNDGSKAYLFAVREGDGTVGFRVAKATPAAAQPFQVLALNAAGVAFDPMPTNFSAATTYVKYLQIDNKIVALSNAGEPVKIFRVGSVKQAITVQSISRPLWSVDDKATVVQPNVASVNDPAANPPLSNAAASTANTLLASGSTGYWVAYYYTFSNDIGESAASQPKSVNIRRRWSAWSWMTPNASSEPSTTETSDPAKVADQLAIYPSAAAFAAAVAEKATVFNVYAITWSDQDSVPVEGVLVGTKEITPGLTHAHCYVRHTPVSYDANRTLPVPNINTRQNYSDPSRAAQGIVASDRMVLVNDPSSAAVIRWTSNRMGEYTNFTASRGGGYKTLTSGNLYVPACVKLWQNPQSADTLTILCLGVDGHSTAYYMAPAQVASQSEAVNIMGFEETTATPGTTSPYGVEVLNNALYHPLETELMKSTASNYNINHKSMTDLIRNVWGDLLNKSKIVSSAHDNRLYYLVHNRHGAALEPGCWGNEVWVCDTAVEGGSWSRWLVQGQSLRKIEVGGRVVMSLSKPDGIYCFDEDASTDEYVGAGRAIASRPIPWRIETNTQGANRAHDAWAHLQQVTLTLGNFLGKLKWGVRGYDLHGQEIERSKVTEDTRPAPADGLPFDRDDHLLVQRDMKEWVLFAESLPDEPSAGQLNLVQYRYTPVSVNVGYEYGSVETFEYTRGNTPLYDNGVPAPYVDTRRP